MTWLHLLEQSFWILVVTSAAAWILVKKLCWLVRLWECPEKVLFTLILLWSCEAETTALLILIIDIYFIFNLDKRRTKLDMGYRYWTCTNIRGFL